MSLKGGGSIVKDQRDFDVHPMDDEDLDEEAKEELKKLAQRARRESR